MSLPTLDALEARRLDLTARLDALPDAAVHRPPAPGAWSLAQIADHLVRIERTVRLGGPPAPTLTAATSGVRAALINGVLALPLRVPVPPGAGRVVPAPDARWDDVRDAWAALRSDWRAKLPRLDPRVAVFKHPIVGLLCVPDALRFVLAHHRHHDAQVARTIAAVAPETAASA